MMNFLRKHAVLALWVLVAGLAVRSHGAGQGRDESGFLPTASDAPPAVATPTNLAPAAAGSSGYVLDDKRRLLPGDRVSFQILEDRTNAVSLLVTESSELDIPYIGRLNVGGKTCRELADEVKTLLEKDYYYRASVIIGLDSLAKVLGKVYIWGPVRTQGPIEIPANEVFTAGKAILRAGGFTDFANKKDVRVVRKTPTGSETLKVNMIEVFDKGNPAADITLEPEDFIIVPQRAINF
ncbi:MAG: polysaccharide export protein [Verrucomicrobiae bacterium]|nr:polysaccharide export protein [Verrucomicrobiae bacterium]